MVLGVLPLLNSKHKNTVARMTARNPLEASITDQRVSSEQVPGCLIALIAVDSAAKPEAQIYCKSIMCTEVSLSCWSFTYASIMLPLLRWLSQTPQISGLQAAGELLRSMALIHAGRGR